MDELRHLVHGVIEKPAAPGHVLEAVEQVLKG